MKQIFSWMAPAVMIFSIAFSSLFGGCAKNTFDTVPPEDSTANTVCDTLDYNRYIRPIIDAKCVTCHYNGGNLPDLSVPANVTANKDKIIDQVYVKQAMPPDGSPDLTQAESDLLRAWLDCGADVSAKVVLSYQSDVVPILQSKCIICHTSGGTGPGDFNDYNVVKDKIDNNNLRSLVNDDIMPKSGATALTAGEKETLLKWIDDGANQN
ncbi:c-type cytochrome [bacterium SCSIO 12741]|nr:c-type cytochrome [bacterium SCSIO 12741]